MWLSGLLIVLLLVGPYASVLADGPKPWNAPIESRTPSTFLPPPQHVAGMATSDSSIELWWDPPFNTTDAIGYRVFYTTSAGTDLEQLSYRDIPFTPSFELTNLDRDVMYTIQIAARTNISIGEFSEAVVVKVTADYNVVRELRARSVTTHSITLAWKRPLKTDPKSYKISYSSEKQFRDSQGLKQLQIQPPRHVDTPYFFTEYTFRELSPFTRYQVNVTAVPEAGGFTPPAKITVTTAMAAPPPMVKPDFYVVGCDQISLFLPNASEEYGPISHYYLVVVPGERTVKAPDQFTLEELTSAAKPDGEAPYITAKFHQYNIPYLFTLGDKITYDGFINKPLQRGKTFRIFLRAVVDAHQKNLHTSSPFSEAVHVDLDMPIPCVESIPFDFPGVYKTTAFVTEGIETSTVSPSSSPLESSVIKPPVSVTVDESYAENRVSVNARQINGVHFTQGWQFLSVVAESMQWIIYLIFI